MTLEEKIKKIEEKIANLFQEKFDEEENYIVENNPRLIKLIHQTLLSNPHLINDDIFEFIPNIVLSSLTKEHPNEAYYHYIDNLLKKTILPTTSLNDHFKEINLNQELREHFREEVRKAYQDKSLTIDRFDISNMYIRESIREMLKYGRFDLISQVTNSCIDDEKLLDELWNAYPFDQYQFPILFAKNIYLPGKYIDQFPIEAAIIAYVELLGITGFDTEAEEREKHCNLLPTYLKSLKERLKQIDIIDISFLYEHIENFSKLIPGEFGSEGISEQNEKDMLEVAVKLFKLGIVDLTGALLKRSLISREEARNVIIKLVQSGDHEKYKKTFKFNCSFNPFKDDKELITFLLENGFVDEANDIDYNILEDKKDYIIEQLNNKNEKFKYFASTITYTDYTLADPLYLAMLNSGFTIKITTSPFCDFNDDDKINELRYILTKYSNIKFDISNMDFNDFLKILDALEETKRIEIIVEYLKLKSFKEPENLKNINRNKILNKIIASNFTQGTEILKEYIALIIKIPELLEEYLKNDYYTHRILDLVNHDENLELFYTEENYNRVKKYLSKISKIPIETLDKLQNQFGPLIIKYIDNENIRAIANLPTEEQDKVLALFPKEEYTLQDLQGTYDSLKQYEFSKKHASQVQIFPTLLHAIEDNNEELIESLILDISKELDQSFLDKFLKKYGFPTKFNKDNISELVRFIVDRIKISTGEIQENYRVMLHEMTDYYISKKREEYRYTYNMEKELEIPYDFEERSLKSTITRHIIIRSGDIQTGFEKPQADEIKSTLGIFGLGPCYTFKEYIIERMSEKGIDKKIAEETINYYISKDKAACSDFNKVKETIPALIKTTTDILSEIEHLDHINSYGIDNRMIEEIINDADSKGEIKRIYKIIDKSNIFAILSQLNIPSLQKSVLSNPEVYESLLQTMKKRKPHLLPRNLSKILDSEYINISSDLTNIAGFISYYGAIHDTVKKILEANGKKINNRLLNITSILIYAEVYSGLSTIYSQILGSEDAKLIKANPENNSATKKLANNGRLKEAVVLTKGLYTRQEITIPPFDQNVSLSNGKEMRIVAGNFTHPSNLTHGERTGACMRIGGAGESLFYFALNNPNGFHIRFEDAKTNEYISRVTGFRNGNTVFLNELRESCNINKYNNEDIIEACTIAANQLIELSKNSPCPIENVVIHRAYATYNMVSPTVNLGVDNIKEGLSRFYSDVGNSVIILATTAKGNKFAPVNLDKSRVPTYRPVREKAKVAESIQEVSGKINRVNSVKRLLAGENYEYIEPMQFPNGLIYAIVNDDWYIYVDSNGKIYTEIIDIDPRAKEELAQALQEVQKNREQIQEGSMEVKHEL